MRRPMQIHLTWLAAPAALAIVLLIGAVQPPSAQALSCAMPTATGSIDRSDIVLVGTIAEGGDLEPEGSLGTGTSASATVEVERYLKGSGPSLVTVHSVTAAWAGGWNEDDIGQRWLFFLQGEGRELDEPACSGSTSLEHDNPWISLEEVEAITGPGVAPEDGGGDAAASSSASLAIGAGVSAFLAAIGGLGVAYIRRR
ncbi:MAG: hypothetical protein WD533_00610 [Dehalococcoidia bacterium]